MRNLVLLTVVVFFLFMSTGVISPITSLYTRDLGASYAMLGLLGTVGSVTSLAFSYLWGHISDRTAQRKRYMIIGLGTMALTRGLTAFVPSYTYLFPIRVVEAVAMSAYSVSSLALMGDVLERRQGRGARMGTYRGLASFGFGLVAFISGAIADRFGLNAPFVVSSTFLAIAFVLSLGLKDVGAETARRVEAEEQATLRAEALSGAAPRQPERRLPIMPLLVSALVWSLVTGAVYQVWANYMVDELKYTPTIMSRLWATASTSELIFMILAGWLSDRLGRLPMLAAGFVAWTLVFSGYVFIPMMPWIVLVQLVRGFAFSAYTATAMTYATEVRARAQRGRASGLYASAGGAGSILGALLGGSLVQLLGFVPMISICAGLTFLAAGYIGICALRWQRLEASSVY